MNTTSTRPRVLVLSARGTNRDLELAAAFELVGADAEIRLVTQLRRDEGDWSGYQLVAVPGGFSHGDALGAGRLLGLDLATWFGDRLRGHIERGRPVIGICNGFQALVRAGFLPGGPAGGCEEPAVLTHNESGRFECRWVDLLPEPISPWTASLDGPLRCPVAHGEGRWVGPVDRVALRYAEPKGNGPAGGAYPANPNGSIDDVAGVVDATGLVLGLMPHPEDHVLARHDPHRRRGSARQGSCLPLFEAGVAHAAHT
ncbi:MAG: phosphoribosylformylglycinamidine synthase subunit PurQ [Actinomycetota bacterium]